MRRPDQPARSVQSVKHQAEPPRQASSGTAHRMPSRAGTQAEAWHVNVYIRLPLKTHLLTMTRRLARLNSALLELAELPQSPYSTRTVPAHPRNTACGYCAPFGHARCPPDLGRPPSGVCLRRSRPLSHPKGDPGRVVGNGSGEPAGRRGGNHRGTHPQAPGFPKGSPRTPFLCPSRPTRRARYAGKSALAQAERQPARNHDGRGETSRTQSCAELHRHRPRRWRRYANARAEPLLTACEHDNAPLRMWLRGRFRLGSGPRA